MLAISLKESLKVEESAVLFDVALVCSNSIKNKPNNLIPWEELILFIYFFTECTLRFWALDLCHPPLKTDCDMPYFLCQTNCDRVALETRVNLLHFQKEKPFWRWHKHRGRFQTASIILPEVTKYYVMTTTVLITDCRDRIPMLTSGDGTLACFYAASWAKKINKSLFLVTAVY